MPPYPTGKIQYSVTPPIVYENLTLNEIVSKMTDEEILGFIPYNTLAYWTEGVDIIITIDELLAFFGYTYPEFEKENVSTKTKGTFDNPTRHRISTLFCEDIVLFNNVTSQKLIHILSSRFSRFS